MQFNQGVYQNQNGLGPTAFNAPEAGTQGQYNPLELIMQLFKKKQADQQANPSMGQSMTHYQQPMQAGVDYPNFNQGMMPRGETSPNGQIMPSMMRGLLG
jgi:hypothetical protein